MKPIYLIYLLSLFILGCSKQSHNQVEQLVVMLGSDEFDFDQAVVMQKLSEGGGFGVGGEDWGGEVTIFSDGEELSNGNSGGIMVVVNSKSKKIELIGESQEALYFGVMYQLFKDWPDDVGGVLLYKKKIEAGVVNLELDPVRKG